MVAKETTKKPKVAKAAVAKPAVEAKETVARKPHRRVLVGVVTSDKMQKTIVVKVDRQVRYALYQKYILRSCKYKAHDETNTAKVGDLVNIIESRPLSRDKRWALQKIVRRANQTIEVAV